MSLILMIRAGSALLRVVILSRSLHDKADYFSLPVMLSLDIFAHMPDNRIKVGVIVVNGRV